MNRVAVNLRDVWIRKVVAVLCLASLFACTTVDEDSEDDGKGTIMVSLRASSSLARFRRATTANGNVVPKNYVRGGLTRLSQPVLLTFEDLQERLYVPNSGDNSVLFFDNIREAVENQPPTRFLQGAGTQLNRPVQVKLDRGRDLLYVANAGSNAVLVFNAPDALSANVAPVRTLSGGNTRLQGISSIELDTSNDRLWVADSTANAVFVWENASSLNGNVPPGREIRGGNTRLLSPQYLLLDDSRLFVACSESILRFENAGNAVGNIAPTAVVTGANTNLNRPQQMQMDTEENVLYVADAGTSAILVFDSARTATGAPVPVRKILGANTTLSDVTGLILDLADTTGDEDTDATPTETATSNTTTE